MKNFSFLSQSTTKLKKTTNLVSETIKAINDYQDKLNKINGSKADTVKQKLHSYFSNIEGFKVMSDFMHIRRGRPG
jgi:DNA-binding protein Fis